MDGDHDIDDAGGRMEYLMLGAARNRVLSEIRIVVRCNVARQEKIEPFPSGTGRDIAKPAFNLRLPPCGVFFFIHQTTQTVIINVLHTLGALLPSASVFTIAAAVVNK